MTRMSIVKMIIAMKNVVMLPTMMLLLAQTLNPSPPGHTGRHFADDILSCIFVITEKFCILITILPKFIPTGQIDNNPALV